MGVTFDSTKLRDLKRAIRGLGTPSFRTDANRLCAVTALSMIEEGFSASKDPYGNPWRPLKDRVGLPLLDTGRLRSSYSTRADSTGFTVSTNVAYAAIHNFGGTVSRGARTELRRYTSGSKRRRLSLYSGNKRSLLATANHQAATGTIPQRQMVPDSGRLPQSWKDAFGVVLEQLLQRRFRGVE